MIWWLKRRLMSVLRYFHVPQLLKTNPDKGWFYTWRRYSGRIMSPRRKKGGSREVEMQRCRKQRWDILSSRKPWSENLLRINNIFVALKYFHCGLYRRHVKFIPDICSGASYSWIQSLSCEILSIEKASSRLRVHAVRRETQMQKCRMKKVLSWMLTTD